MKLAAVICNGIGSEDAFPDRPDLRFEFLHIDADFSPQLDKYDILIAPNGTDHVALYRNRDAIRAFLDQGKSLLCFCGWFLDWIPGNRWIHDNSHPTREVRHHAGNDEFQLLDGVDLAQLDHNRHGISGWWACGYIEPAPGASVLIFDTWQRALVITDSVSTRGFMFLTASGPLGDYSRYGFGDGPVSQLYNNLMHFLVHRDGPLANSERIPPCLS